MSIAEKLQTITENEQRVYDAGKSSAVMSGTITFTDAAKALSITGLPSLPKELNIYSMSTAIPTDNSKYYVRALDYIADGFSLAGSSAKIMGFLWLRVSTEISATATGSSSVSEKTANQNNIFIFENETFTIDFSYNPTFTFGEGYTYRWTATF